jgi:hypothetical protein
VGNRREVPTGRQALYQSLGFPPSAAKAGYERCVIDCARFSEKVKKKLAV